MNPEGPYVSVAAICEGILHEKSEKISCIRFIDRIDIQTPSDDDDAPVRLRLNAFISFKSGPFVGSKDCFVQLRSPSGKLGKLTEKEPPLFPMTFNGDERGHNLIMTFELPVTESGVYWFDVMLDEEVFARIPLRVTITRQAQIHEPGSSRQTPDQS